MVRRTLEGAEKCALRDFLLEEDRAGRTRVSIGVHGRRVAAVVAHTGVDLGHLVGGWASPDSLSGSKVAGRHKRSSSRTEKATSKFCAPVREILGLWRPASGVLAAVSRARASM